MLRCLLGAVLFLGLVSSAMAQNPRVWIDTDLGPIIVELDEVNAPMTTDNFLDLVNDEFYDGLIFHRVIPDVIIQSGTFTERGSRRDSDTENVPSESNNGLSNVPGTIAMVLIGSDVDSAKSGFFINTGDNSESLDENFTVFGEVVIGMSTVDTINDSAIFSQMQNFPIKVATILRAVQVEDAFPVMPLHSGSWFDPNNPGVGLNIEVANDASTEEGPVLVAYWYDFTDGQQVWLTGSQAFDYGASSVTVEMFSFSGEDAGFQNPPPTSELESWGTLTVSFDDCSTGRFAYDSPTAGEGELTLGRLTLPDQASCEAID